MNTKIKYILIVSLLITSISFGIFQSVVNFKAEEVSAVTVGVPNPGHTWSSMECSGDSLCIDPTGSKLGIGTNTPSEKLTVAGNLSITGSMTGGTVPAARIGAGTLSGSYVFNSAVSLGGNTLNNVATPINDSDAATKGYVVASMPASAPRRPAPRPGGRQSALAISLKW
jgi:hypothetical protein